MLAMNLERSIGGIHLAAIGGMAGHVAPKKKPIMPRRAIRAIMLTRQAAGVMRVSRLAASMPPPKTQREPTTSASLPPVDSYLLK